MARPQKKGISYFSFDVDFFEDEKILPVKVKHGAAGELVIIKILCALYRSGYFIVCTEGLMFKIASQVNESEALVKDVIELLAKYNFFNKSLYLNYSVLTSKGIQRRWKEATRKRVAQNDFRYWLLNEKEFVPEDNLVSGGRMAEETPIYSHEINKIKLNNTKVNYEEVKKWYNQYCTCLRPLNSFTDDRKKSITALATQFGSKKIEEMIITAGKSKFLSGQNKNQWQADFDWLIKPTNFIKVLEGKYNERDKNNNGNFNSAIERQVAANLESLQNRITRSEEMD